jgi:hypothetical protein
MPVREGLGAPERREPSSEVPVPTRTFVDAEGRVWIVEAAGQDRTGTGSDAGAPLLLLLFRPAPGAGGEDESGSDVLEALVIAAELDELGDDRLTEILAGAAPSGYEPRELFPGTRRGRGGT